MPVGDFPNPAGMVWSDAIGWYRPEPMAFTLAPTAPDITCERARRDAGLPAQIHCRICARGPCGRKADETTLMAAFVPNRLKGTTINQDGDAT